MSNNTINIGVIVAFQTPKESGGFYSNIIKWWTKSEYIHCEIILTVENIPAGVVPTNMAGVVDANDNLALWVSSTIERGVRIKKLTPLTDNYVYYRIKPVTVTVDQFKQLLAYLDKIDGGRYDKVGIALSQVVPLRLDNRNEWFCSELVAKVLQLTLYPGTEEWYPQTMAPKHIEQFCSTVREIL